MRTRKFSIALIAVGVVTAVAHAALAIAGVLDTGGWVSGIVIGLLVAGAGNHLRVFGRR